MKYRGANNDASPTKSSPLVDAVLTYAAKRGFGSETYTFSNQITLYINGKKYVITNPSPRLLLVDFLRNELRLTGTKVGCSEGGCGSCTVTMACHDGSSPKSTASSSSTDGKILYYPINACLRPLCSLDGCSITTIEGVGSTAKDDMNPIQQQMAKCNGTQCGFCTPGWVNNMYGFLMENNGIATEEQIEKHFDGNLCRCTGYRPILDAMKSFASNPDEKPDTLKVGYNNENCNLSNSNVSMQKADEDNVKMCKHNRNKICSGLCHHNENEDEEDDDWVKAESHLPRNICGQTASITDIEDVVMTQKTNSYASKAKKFVEKHQSAFPAELINYEKKRLHFTFEEINSANQMEKAEWFKVYSVDEILHLLKSYQSESIQLLAGNTSLGVSKYYNDTQPKNAPDQYNIFIDIVDVPDFKIQTFNSKTRELNIGASVTINNVIEILEQHRRDDPSYLPYAQSLLSVMVKHLRRVAHEQVRNVGTWAGNLMLFKRHDNFPSDINLLWSSCDVILNIIETMSGKTKSISMNEFWEMDMFADQDKKSLAFVIVSMTMKLPDEVPSADQIKVGDTLTVARSFRIAQRYANSHAHCHAAYCLKVQWNGPDSPVTCRSARVTYGAVTKTTVRATKCETALKDAVMDENSLNSCLIALEEDLNNAGPTEAYGDQEYRRILARNYLYGVFLAVQPTLPPELASVADPFLNYRPISKGSQSFTTDPDEAPVSYPIKKLGGDIQTTGEARYADDEPFPKQGCFGAFVYSEKALAKFKAIDISTAKAFPGVIDVILATDIPGTNCVSPKGDEKLLLEIGDSIECCGAPLAIVIATTHEVALNAARIVAVTYEDLKNEKREPLKPILTLADAINAQSFIPGDEELMPPFEVGNVDMAIKNATHTLSGRISTGGQRHFYFEPQSSVAIPQEENCTLKVFVSAQDPTTTHTLMANTLGVAKHNIDIVVNRVGGGFGGKLGRCNFNALGTAVAALKLKQAVKIVNDRTTDFNMIGGREALVADYNVGFDDNGKINGLEYKMYMESGPAIENTFSDLDMAMLWSDNLYYLPNYRLTPFVCKTNTAVTTSTRAPGVVQAVQCIEEVLERIAKSLNKNVTDIQEANFYQNGQTTPYGQTIDDIDTFTNVWSVLKDKSQFAEKKQDCEKFNAANRWIKRGVAITGVKYGIAHAGVKASASVKIFQEDGSVLINHSGCEIGQGISTKVAQACAYKLNIPLNLIKVRATATDKIPNFTGTGGSATSEVTVQAMLNGCDELLKRLQPYVKDDDGKTRDWLTIISSASADGVMLSVEGWYSPLPGDDFFKYYVYCAAVTEVELHVLTGEVVVLYSELQYDCGQSLNPAVDLGQIEGGFIQGLGYYLTEEVVYDVNTGQLISSGTWDYKPPCAYDIPLNLVVNFVPNDSNPKGVLRSKATGEPPMIVSNAVFFAVKDAIYAARKDASDDGYFELLVPACNDVRLKASLVDPSQYKLK